MINKVINFVEDTVSDVQDGAVILASGFGNAGAPNCLLEALMETNAKYLTVVANNAGESDYGLAALIGSGKVSKVICSYPISSGSTIFQKLYNTKEIDLELVPQGTLSERLRAAGAGIGGFYTRTSVGSLLATEKEKRKFNNIEYVLEYGLKGDFALIRGKTADRWGNIIYDKSARNVGPIMAAAATTTIAQVEQIVKLGEIDPELIVTPGIYVDKVYLKK